MSLLKKTIIIFVFLCIPISYTMNGRGNSSQRTSPQKPDDYPRGVDETIDYYSEICCSHCFALIKNWCEDAYIDFTPLYKLIQIKSKDD